MAKSDLDRAPIFMVRTRQGTLAPASSFDAERLDAIAIGAQVEVTIKQRRSSPQNRLYWSILSKVVDNIDGYQTSEALHEALKLHLGYTEKLQTITGHRYSPYLAVVSGKTFFGTSPLGPTGFINNA